jgi:thiamine biosynthesis lipoprotein
MGTRFELVLAGDDSARLRAAGEAALDQIEELHRALTRFEPSSLLAHLRRMAPRPVAVGRELFGLFAGAAAIQRDSGGGFDPGWDPDGLRLDPDAATVALDRDRPLDFGAIAKGYALDRAAALLRLAGVERAFVHGGTSSAIGIGTGWRIRLGGGPEPATGPIVTLADAALGVSDTRGHRGDGSAHIRDPRTGRPAVPRRAAVVGPSAMLADAWSTAAAVLGYRPPALGAEWRLWLGEPGSSWQEVER